MEADNSRLCTLSLCVYGGVMTLLFLSLKLHHLAMKNTVCCVHVNAILLQLNVDELLYSSCRG